MCLISHKIESEYSLRLCPPALLHAYTRIQEETIYQRLASLCRITHRCHGLLLPPGLIAASRLYRV